MKKHIWKILKVIIVIGIIGYVIRNNGGIRMIEEMAGAKFSWILLSAFCFFISIVLGSLQWFLLSKIQQIKISFSNCFKIYYMGMFLNAVMFNLAGDALRVYKLKSAENQVTTGMVSTFMDRFLGLCVLSLFSMAAVITIWYRDILSEKYVKSLVFVSLIIFLSFATGAAAISSRRFGALFQNIFKKLRLNKIENFYEAIKECLLKYREMWRSVLLISFISAAVHSFRIIGHYFCAKSLGIEISLLYFYCFIPIISLVTLIPLNIGGWGFPQGIGAKLYAIPGVITGLNSSGLANDSIRFAAGKLTFLPSIIFSIIMLMGGLFFIAEQNISKKE